MRKTLIGLMISLLVAIGMILAAPAQASLSWQAIYYSPSTTLYGWGRGYATAGGAMARAYLECGMTDCAPAAIGQAYVALADNAYLWHGGVGYTAAEAAADALTHIGGSGRVITIVSP